MTDKLITLEDLLDIVKKAEDKTTWWDDDGDLTPSNFVWSLIFEIQDRIEEEHRKEQATQEHKIIEAVHDFFEEDRPNMNKEYGC